MSRQRRPAGCGTTLQRPAETELFAGAVRRAAINRLDWPGDVAAARFLVLPGMGLSSFGGRQSARTLHFVAASLLLFVGCAVESFAHIGGGKGGYWEDDGYQWIAAI